MVLENQSLVPKHLCHLEGSQPYLTPAPGNPMPLLASVGTCTLVSDTFKNE